MQGQPVVHRDLLPLLDHRVRCQGADEAKPWVINPGPATVGIEGVICFMSKTCTVLISTSHVLWYINIILRIKMNPAAQFQND